MQNAIINIPTPRNGSPMENLWPSPKSKQVGICGSSSVFLMAITEDVCPWLMLSQVIYIHFMTGRSHLAPQPGHVFYRSCGCLSHLYVQTLFKYAYMSDMVEKLLERTLNLLPPPFYLLLTY